MFILGKKKKDERLTQFHLYNILTAYYAYFSIYIKIKK